MLFLPPHLLTMTSHRPTLLTLALLLLGTLALNACNTVNGAGKDVQKAGQSIERASGK